jgi:D-alanyl-D-alanine carboxypeptidase
VHSRPIQWVLRGLSIIVLSCVTLAFGLTANAAPYAAMVMDARTGEVLHSRNADTRLHPASLTKMMTLYIAFEAIERGEISLETRVAISKKAANEPPSKLGLKSGQKIQFRYLIRAASVKSANDAATAIAEAISGSEAAFARRMNRTAKAIGMSRTTFKNAHGLTESGHMSTARDMTLLGRRLFYDHPKYYNLFSRKTTDAGVRQVSNTNRRFLNAYKGADGIKTGYTRAAGFNLVASAQLGQERIIATVFGGRSSAWRNTKMGELMDLGFRRAPSKARTRKPKALTYQAPEVIASKAAPGHVPGTAGKTIRLIRAPKKSIRPMARPIQAPAEEVLVAMAEGIDEAVAEVGAEAQAPDSAETDAAVTAALQSDAAEKAAEVVAEPTEIVVASILPKIRPKPRTERAEPVVPAPVVAVATPDATAPSPVARPAAKAPAPVVLASIAPDVPETPALNDAAAENIALEVVTRLSTSGGRSWGINVGRYGSRYQAERVLLKTALLEIETLDDALRKVVPRKAGHEANFVGMSEFDATLACRRLTARGVECSTISPTG